MRLPFPFHLILLEIEMEIEKKYTFSLSVRFFFSSSQKKYEIDFSHKNDHVDIKHDVFFSPGMYTPLLLTIKSLTDFLHCCTFLVRVCNVSIKNILEHGLYTTDISASKL